MIGMDTLRFLLDLAERAVVALERQADAAERMVPAARSPKAPRPFLDRPTAPNHPGDQVRG